MRKQIEWNDNPASHDASRYNARIYTGMKSVHNGWEYSIDIVRGIVQESAIPTGVEVFVSSSSIIRNGSPEPAAIVDVVGGSEGYMDTYVLELARQLRNCLRRQMVRIILPDRVVIIGDEPKPNIMHETR